MVVHIKYNLLILLIMFNIIFANSKCNHETKIFDFVIIGGGTAGCVLAARLSERNRFNVALVEAGGEPPLISKVPSLAELMIQSEVDWNYTSVSQRDALLSYPNQVMNMTRGKMLGGSGSLNNMNFFRGNKLNIRSWKNDGAKGWEWNRVLNFFKKIEGDSEIGVNQKFHGHCAPICITNPGGDDPFVNSFLAAVKKFGYSFRDPNGDGKQTGYSYAPINVCNNERQSTYTNYLKPALSRSNLKVVTFAFVEKILFNKCNRAIDVVYTKNGCRRTVKVRKEVIVSGGAINSPQILMLSGIGPRKHLESMNISVLSGLPVGDNFQDHMRVNLLFTKPYEDIYNNKTLAQFFEGKGPLTSFAFGNAFVNTRYSKQHFNPDIQLSLSAFSNPVSVGKNLTFFLRAVICRSKSNGTVRLNSSNPYDYPMIDPRYLSNEEDVKVLAEGSKIAYAVSKLMNVSQYGFTRTEISASSCNGYERNSDEYWKCVVRNNAVTLYHFSGTCRMGKRKDKRSVVDGKLRVIGVKRLRVVDASVMPSLTNGNIQPPVVMIAERAASFIAATYLKLGMWKN